MTTTSVQVQRNFLFGKRSNKTVIFPTWSKNYVYDNLIQISD